MLSTNHLKKITKMKMGDSDGKMAKLVNLITICPDVGGNVDDEDAHRVIDLDEPVEEHEHRNEAADKEAAVEAGFTIYSWTEVIDKGRAAE